MELELERTELSGYETVLNTTLFQEETMEMIVPDACPDILRILDTEGWVELKSREASEGHAAVSGTIRACVLYLPDGEEGIRQLDVSIPFSGGVDGARLNHRCSLVSLGRIEGAETRALNPRKVLVRVGIAVELQGYAPLEEAVCSSVHAESKTGVEQLCETCHTYGVVCVQEKPFQFSDEVTLPGSKPQAAGLLKQRVTVVCTESKVIGNKLIFKGNVNLQILYRSVDHQICDSLFELPFSQIMEVSGGGEEADCTLEIMATEVQCSLESGEDGRIIHVALELLAQAVLRAERSVAVLCDLYSTSYLLEAERCTHSMEHLIDRSVKTPALREVVECGESIDNILDAYLSVGRMAQNREGERLVLEAEVRATILYRTEGGESGSVSRVFSVPCSLELPDGCRCTCVCRCPEPVFATPTAGGIEVRFAVEFRYMALRSEPITGISAARLDPDSPRDRDHQPSIVLRMVGRGERLWDIAKCYGTTMAEICRANALEEEQAPGGQLLLIPRKRA